MDPFIFAITLSYRLIFDNFWHTDTELIEPSVSRLPVVCDVVVLERFGSIRLGIRIVCIKFLGKNSKGF